MYIDGVYFSVEDNKLDRLTRRSFQVAIICLQTQGRVKTTTLKEIECVSRHQLIAVKGVSRQPL